MLEGKALVVAIMMLTAAPLVVTDDGRAIVGDVTSDVTDMFTDEKSAEDPKRDEVLDDAVDKTNEKDLELDRKELASKDSEEGKSCYYLEEIKEEMIGDKEGWDKEGKDDWDKEDAWSEEFKALLESCKAGEEESCEELEALREELAEDRKEESDEEESEEQENDGSRSGDDGCNSPDCESDEESEEESEREELDEEFIAEMEELKEACGEGNEESCEELREIIAELMANRRDDIQLVIGEDGVVYYEDRKDKDWDREDKDWNREEKDWDEVCLTMEEWKEVFEKDRKEKDFRHKDDHKRMNIEDFMHVLEEMGEEEISEIKQITNTSDEEWDEMVVKLETKNMTEEDWKTVMEKMKLFFEHEMKVEREEMEAFRAQMKEFDDACEAGNETACEELSAMMAEIEENFREDKEGCEEREEDESEEEESEEEESDEDESEEDLE